MMVNVYHAEMMARTVSNLLILPNNVIPVLPVVSPIVNTIILKVQQLLLSLVVWNARTVCG
jgi:hypothetical protein